MLLTYVVPSYIMEMLNMLPDWLGSVITAAVAALVALLTFTLACKVYSVVKGILIGSEPVAEDEEGPDEMSEEEYLDFMDAWDQEDEDSQNHEMERITAVDHGDGTGHWHRDEFDGEGV